MSGPSTVCRAREPQSFARRPDPRRPDEACELANLAQVIRDAVDRIPDRRRRFALTEYFGLAGQPPRHLWQIAQAVFVSVERARQIKERGLDLLYQDPAIAEIALASGVGRLGDHLGVLWTAHRTLAARGGAGDRSELDWLAFATTLAADDHRAVVFSSLHRTGVRPAERE